MKTYSGKAKIKEEYQHIYAGETLDITEVYIEYKNGQGMGVYADGSREYRLNLVGTKHEYDGKYHNTSTVIHDANLDIIELFETIKMPFNENETEELVKFIKTNPDKGIVDYIKANTKESVPPVPDLTTLY